MNISRKTGIIFIVSQYPATENSTFTRRGINAALIVKTVPATMCGSLLLLAIGPYLSCGVDVKNNRNDQEHKLLSNSSSSGGRAQDFLSVLVQIMGVCH